MIHHLDEPRPSRAKAKVIVFGILFWYPLAGVTYQFLHYLIGLRRLGYDVYYVEDSARYVYDPTINDLSADAANNVQAIAPILDAHGFAGRWAFREAYERGRCFGMDEASLRQLYHDADACLNVCGAQEIRDEHRRIPRRIYVESDPFASQVKVVNGDEKMLRELADHDTFFTFGENTGQLDCGIPRTSFAWQPTRQPVVLDLWDEVIPPGDAFNTITTWSNVGKHVVYDGETYYWTKDREFEKVIDLPKRCDVPFEIAAGVGPDVRSLLVNNGWRHVDSVTLSTDPVRYRSYIQQSRGEFTVARDQYVRPKTGWFSDRTACYLAAGRPVITQETGFSKFIRSGEGLFGWTTIDDVLSAVDAIQSDYAAHSRAAREVAREFFDAEVVLRSLMERAGL